MQICMQLRFGYEILIRYLLFKFQMKKYFITVRWIAMGYNWMENDLHYLTHWNSDCLLMLLAMHEALSNTL